MLHNVLYIMGFAPYIALPFISGYLPIEFSLMVSVAITSLVTYAMSRVGGVRLHGRKGLSFVTGGVAVYLNYNLVNRASPSDRNGNREIEIFLEGVDTPLTLQFESRKQYEAVSRLLELRISSGRRGYLDQT